MEELTIEEYNEIEMEMISELIKDGYYKVVKNKMRAKKLDTRDDTEVRYHKPANGWVWAKLEDNELFCDDEKEYVKCHGSGSGMYDSTYGSSGIY